MDSFKIRWKRWLSLVLAVILILGNLPVGVLAAETDSASLSLTLTPEDYLTVSKDDAEQLACAPSMVAYADDKIAVSYLADEVNSVETEASTTIVCRLGLFDLSDPENGTFFDIATAGQSIGNVTIGSKAPYEPNLLKLSDRELLVLFNIRDTSGSYTYYSATFDTSSNAVTSYQPLTLDGQSWTPANIAASYNRLAENAISTSGPAGSMVFTSKIISHNGYYYGYCGGIASGFSGILVRSTDGINWTSVMVPEAAPDMAGVIECGFQFLDDYVYFCMRDISSGVYHCSYHFTSGEQIVSTSKISGLTTSKPAAFIQDGSLYLIVNKATGDDSTVGRRNTAQFYRIDPRTCRLSLVRQVFCADGCAYHCVEEIGGKNYWSFHTDARRINPYTQGRSNLAFLEIPEFYAVEPSVDGILNLDAYSHMFASGCITAASNTWQTGVVNMHYQIPLADFAGFDTVTVTANADNKCYISFFTDLMTKAGAICYADGWTEQLIMEPGTTETLQIPADAQYLYILNNNAAGNNLLPESVVFQTAEDILAGKTISILGDSISTYKGISNSAAYNSTIGGSAVYYSPGTLGVYQADTWWQQAADALGMKLLVNNSWSGSCILHTRSGTAGAYAGRCVQLHNDSTGEEPDVIAVFLGTNDFSYYQSALGTADIDYAALITENGDGAYTYAAPATSCEAYAVMLHKMRQRYPNAQIYCLSMTARRDPDKADSYADVGQPTAFNAELAKIVDRFGCIYVDLQSRISKEAAIFDTYMGDGRVHPNAAGMDKITEALLSAMLDSNAEIRKVTYDLSGVEAGNQAGTVLLGSSYSTVLDAGGQNMDVTVTMDGEDVTELCYADGTVTVSSVTGDLVIQAFAEKDPENYRWELEKSALICAGEHENAPTLLGGSVKDGILSNAYFKLAKPVVLRADLPWVVEFKASGAWSGMIFSAMQSSGSDGNTFLFKTTTNTGLIAFGERANNQYENYGIPLTSLGVDTAAEHTYRLENRIAEDGSNQVRLLIDGTDYGSMDRHFIGGSSDQGKHVDWVSGKDFRFSYIGANSHTMTNCALSYLQVWEGGHTHTYENGTCTGCGDINITWEIGTIATANGNNTANATRLRTIDYLELADFSGVCVNLGYQLTWLAYDAEKNYIGNGTTTFTGYWQPSGQNVVTADIQNLYSDAVYFRIALKAVSGGSLTLDDVLNSGVTFIPFGEALPEVKYELEYDSSINIGSWQDGAIWNGKLFVLGSTGTGAVYDLENLTKLATLSLDGADVLKPHANSVCFGSTYYTPGDQYPLLYVNVYNNYASATDRMEGTCCVYRISETDGNFNTELVQVIKIGFTEDLTLWKSKENNGDVRPYGNFLVDTVENKLYAYVMRDADKTTRFFCFNLPKLTNGTYSEAYGCNVVTLESTDIEGQFDTEYFKYLQGGTYSSGVILSAEGFNSGSSAEPAIRIINLKTKTVDATYYMANSGLTSEPEVVCIDPVTGLLYYAAADGVLRILTIPDVHFHAYTATVTPPTCTEKGYTTYTCTLCGDSYVDEYTDKLNLTVIPITSAEVEQGGYYFGQDSQLSTRLRVADQIFVEAGTTVKYCTNGLRVFFAIVSGPDADCYLDGGQWYTDSGEFEVATDGYLSIIISKPNPSDEITVSDYISDIEIHMISDCAHDYETVVVAPTVTADGYTTHTCTKCGHRYITDYTEGKTFRILLIGNSFSQDATRQFRSAARALLGEDVKIEVHLAINAAKTVAWHATQASQNNQAYKHRYIVGDSDNFVYEDDPLSTLEEIIQLKDWDVVTVQSFYPEVNSGTAIGLEGESDQFLSMNASVPFMLDYIDRYAPQAKIYYYMAWQSTQNTSRLDAGRAEFEQILAQAQILTGHSGTDSARAFDGVIPVGTAIQNARSTYLGLIDYADDSETVIGLQRDSVHLAYAVGGYIAALTFAEYVIPENMRQATYTLPEIPKSTAIGALPEAYTEIAQKAVYAALENPYSVTAIAGFETDPADVAKAQAELLTPDLSAARSEDELAAALTGAVQALLGQQDFDEPAVTVHSSSFSDAGQLLGYHASAEIRFGYTTRTAELVKHAYAASVTPPACTAQGYTTYTCDLCGNTYNGDYVDALGHDWKDATCTASKTCERCGITEGQPNGHNHKTVVTAPICTEMGYTTYTCTECGDSYVDSYVDAKGHKEEALPAVAATCTATGLTEGKKCGVCGEILVAQTVTEKLGHKEETISAVAATCTATGLTEGKKCSVCGEILSAQQIVPALGHTEVTDAAVAATCKTTGLTEGKHCSVCNAVLVAQEVTDKLPHTEETIPAVAATCTATGLTEGKKCSVCGEILVAQTVTEKLGHKEIIDPAVAATCTATGLTEGKHCETCGTTLAAQTMVPALGHTKVTVPAVAPTCTEAGLTDGETCGVCGIVTKEQTAVPATGHLWNDGVCSGCGTVCEHDYSAENGGCTVCGDKCQHQYDAVVTKPSCTEQGFTSYRCSICGNAYNGDYVEALGHDWVAATCTVAKTCSACGITEGQPNGHNYETVVIAPTCTEKGYTTHTCHCGDTYKDSYTAVSGHTAGEPVEENCVEPTCTAAGSYETVVRCAVCGAELSREKQEIPANGHRYEDSVTAPTCIEQGYTTHTCSVCGDSFKDSYTPADGHRMGQWKVTAEATCTENGKRERVCENCSHAEEEAIPATGHAHKAVVTAPTCTEQGYTTYTCHCGHSYVTDEVKAPGHKYSYKVTAEPTLETAGKVEGICERCDKRFELILPKLNEDDYKYEVITAPTEDSDGLAHYTFTDAVHGTYVFEVKLDKLSTVLLGDVNDDGEITISDLMRLANHFAKDVAINEANADVNADGKVTIADLMRLANFFAGKTQLG